MPVLRCHRRWLKICVLLAGMALTACTTAPHWQPVPLPGVHGDKPIRLSVARVDNPRFPRLDDEQLQAVLSRSVVLVRQHFGLEIAFETPEHISIDTLFAHLPAHVMRERADEIVAFRQVTDEELRSMREGLYFRLLDFEEDREQVVAYARPWLLVPYEGDDLLRLAGALVDTLLLRLRYWQGQKAADGNSIIDDSPYNEWVWWDSLGYGDMPYDVIITNQLVASAETRDMSVHSSLRGGITAGTTAYSREARYRAYTFITVYPMINDNSLLEALRADGHYRDQDVVEYAAALLTHELGHLLLHLGHPFGNRACVMAPTPLLRYRDWVEGLDASACVVGSESQMTPGSAGLIYRADW